jgi:hypothetical protein
MKTFFTAEAQRTQRILFFIKSGDTDFMKDPAAFGGVGSRSDEGFSIRGIPRQWKKVFSASSASLR